MDLNDRLTWLLAGAFIGFVLGYFVRSLREFREEIDTMNPNVKRVTSESGLVRYPLVLDLALFIVVVTTVWAAFMSQKAVNDLQHVVNCTTQYNLKQGGALKSRDAVVKAGVQSEINLWTEYGKLYALATQDPSKIELAQKKLNEAIRAHRDALEETQTARDAFPYPHPNILRECNDGHVDNK